MALSPCSKGSASFTWLSVHGVVSSWMFELRCLANIWGIGILLGKLAIEIVIYAWVVVVGDSSSNACDFSHTLFDDVFVK